MSSALAVRAQRPVARPALRPRASTVTVRASLKPQSFESLINRYDWLSTGVGALSVTTYCVCRGQAPLEAAGLTVVATIAALVANELLFTPPASKDQQGGGDN